MVLNFLVYILKKILDIYLVLVVFLEFVSFGYCIYIILYLLRMYICVYVFVYM